MSGYDSQSDTCEHIRTVRGYLLEVSVMLQERSIRHNAVRFAYGAEIERLLLNTVGVLGE